MILKPMYSTALLALLTILPFHASYAVSENVCDDMLTSGNFSDEEISACTKKYGESDTFKETAEAIKNKRQAAIVKATASVASQNNIEVKKFTIADINKATFNKSVFSTRLEYERNIYVPTVKVVTEGDSLCTFLGYDKAMGVTRLSGEIPPDQANKMGFIITKGLFGSVSTEPKLHVDEKGKYYMRRFEEITCAKAISKEVKGTKDILKEFNETVMVMPGQVDLTAPKTEKSNAVNDSNKPKNKEDRSTTPFSHQRVKLEEDSDSHNGSK
jgi:hypothetical protein